MTDSDLYPQIYSIINAIPSGTVTNYGTIAKLVGCGPRQVGYALHALPQETKLPWHRVVNYAGRISFPPGSDYERQRARLEQEGVTFSLKGRIDMKHYGWKI
ncbi:MAG: MGMT family protein [Pseudomonadales bacterium]|nr:MGMT family protein [Pseudomonadales bacterium]